MFTTDRKVLIDVVNKLQRYFCRYDVYHGMKDTIDTIDPPPFCDCKYGVDNPLSKSINYHGEQTGCPEMRNLLLLLSNISDEEYEGIICRKKDYLSSPIFDDLLTAYYSSHEIEYQNNKYVVVDIDMSVNMNVAKEPVLQHDFTLRDATGVRYSLIIHHVNNEVLSIKEICIK